MMIIGGKNRNLLLLLVSALISGAAIAQVRINEVSDKGSEGACSGEDWIELYNAGTEQVDLEGYVLHDDNGPQGDETFTFPPKDDFPGASPIVQPGEYLVLCAGGGDGSPLSVPFGIGGSDQVTLREPSGAVASSTGSSLDGRGEEGVTLAFDDSTASYVYTTTATPGEANVITKIETVEEMKARLTKQNELGTKFFNMDVNGLPVEDGFPAVVDLRIVMDPSDKAKISGDERGYEVYSPFLSAQVTTFDDPSSVLLDLTSPGRIRPKGQSTMYLGVCTNRTTPYQIDWDFNDPTQQLFGSTKTYLRTAFSDPSFVREWASHRMLARFGLPHLRTRTVRFLINGQYYGLYSLMEAPDQDYVFHRSFPVYDPENYGLYKVKTQSIGCGMFDEASLARAKARINDTSAPPYVFDRGEHRPKPPVLGDEMTCFGPFIQNLIVHEAADVELAYVRSGAGKCGDFLVDQGLVDRDLGDKSRDEIAAAFIDAHLADNVCDEKCANSNLADDVDVVQFLRNFATQAAMLNQDSPLGNGNNWYLAYPGTGDDKWSMVQYDHNNILSATTGLLCDSEQCSDMMKWSILRPTCRNLESNQMAGPLLTDDSLRAQYVEYVREFVNDVMTNEDFLMQIEDHLAAIKDLVAADPWNDFAPVFESHEMAAGEEWLRGIGELPYVAFLPALRARASEIQKELDAIGAGTHPRSAGGYNPGEACADWTADSPPDFACPNNCYYDGCTSSGIVARPFCDPESKTCFTGTLDFQCIGVPNGEPAPGSSSAADSAPSFCLTFDNFPVKASLCPPYEEMADEEMMDEETANGSSTSSEEVGGSGEGEDGTSTSSTSSSSSVLHLLVVVVASLLVSVAAAL